MLSTDLDPDQSDLPKSPKCLAAKLSEETLSEENEKEPLSDSLRLVGTREAGDPLNLGGRFISHPTLHQKRSYPIF